ncbi:MAG: hypothetical protein K9W45_04170 [Candidatus Heimdallarchaeum aukensis]|uniref:Uncharacterized protein n=1 Tax=Candidatus Heimdallarchaeum aukensis TaxID=2876573 RepID=A0A9Y1FLH3_9ARCH|nr:MAG: hypothetical protein K9W45_04170 [Candidatus Heimdallarchaeum aukensis]
MAKKNKGRRKVIESVYIISRTGLPLLYVDFVSQEDDVDAVTLFSGIISAIQVAMAEIDVGVPSFFDTEKNEIFMNVTEKFAIAVVKNQEPIDRNEMNKLMDQIQTLVSFDQEVEDFSTISDETKNKISKKIREIVNNWEDYISEREATKRITESLW